MSVAPSQRANTGDKLLALYVANLSLILNKNTSILSKESWTNASMTLKTKNKQIIAPEN